MLLMKDISVSSSFANGQAGFSEVILGKFQDVLQFFISFFKKYILGLTSSMISQPICWTVMIINDLNPSKKGDCELLAQRVVDRYEHLRCPMRPMSGTRWMSR